MTGANAVGPVDEMRVLRTPQGKSLPPPKIPKPVNLHRYLIKKLIVFSISRKDYDTARFFTFFLLPFYLGKLCFFVPSW
jgi:hypothetical protein